MALVKKEIFVPVVAIQDQDGHWFVIPNGLLKEFREMEEKGEEDEHEAFYSKFSKYRTRGNLNLVQLYIKDETTLSRPEC